MYVCMDEWFLVCVHAAPPSLSVGAVLEVEEGPEEQEEGDVNSVLEV